MNAPEAQMLWKKQVAEMDVILASEGLHPEYRRSVMEKRGQKLQAIKALEIESINTKYQPIGGNPPTHKEWIAQ